MVGVRGRSKACSTCRRRKKGCDLQQPSCGQCRKAGIPCGGYEDSFIIHQYQAAPRPSSSSSSSSRESPSSSKSGSIGSKQEETKAQLVLKRSTPQNEKKQGSTKNSRSDGQPTGSDPSPSPLPSPGSDTFEIQPFTSAASEAGLLGAFWESYYPNSRCGPAFDELQRTLGGSMIILHEHVPRDLVLRQALLATALRMVGRRPDAPLWMEKTGSEIYGNALQEMGRALQNPNRRQSIDILAAVRTFSLHEAIFGSDKNNESQQILTQYQSWMAHNSGDIVLILANPPLYYIHGVAHRLFVDGRLHLILTSLKLRKKIFLGREEWLTIPWSVHPKTARDLLLDIMIGITTLVVDSDTLNATTDEEEKRLLRQIVDKTVLYLSRALGQWHSRHAIAILPTTMGSPLPDYVSNEELAQAHVMTLYWGNCILLDMVRRMALGHTASPSASPHGVTGVDDEEEDPIDPADACHHILRVIPVFLHPSTGAFRQHLVPFPAAAVGIYLSMVGPTRMRQERACMVTFLQQPECAAMSRFLGSIEKQMIADMHNHARIDKQIATA